MEGKKSPASGAAASEPVAESGATTTSANKDANVSTETPAESASQPVARDDDEDSDFEELDDVLDDFSKPKPTTQQPQQPQQQQQHGRQERGQSQKTADEQGPDIDEEEMIKQLEAGMAELMKGGGPGAGAGPTTGEGLGGAGGDDGWNALADELSKSGMRPSDLMKLMLGEDVASGLAEDNAGGSDSAGKAADAQGSAKSDKRPEASQSGENFQDTIQKTMERLQQSGDKATEAANEGEGDDLLMQVLKAMEASGINPEGEGGDENLDKMFMGIMEQLSNKEMLYEPMKELHDKFGPWLKENRDKVSKEDLERYELQSTLVAEIVGKFEEPGFTDDNPEHRAYVWERMQKMQAAGSPPDDLISNPFGDDTKLQEALGGDNPQCPQQ